MSDVTNIKTITNNLVYPVTVRNGENTQQTFTVAAANGWNGDMWIPWVVNAGDMWKSILLEWPSGDGTKGLYVFQHDDHICFSWNNNFNNRGIFQGNSGIRGEKAVIIASDSYVYLN